MDPPSVICTNKTTYTWHAEVYRKCMRTTNSETAVDIKLLFDIIVWLTWNRQKQHEGPGMDPPAIYTNNC